MRSLRDVRLMWIGLAGAWLISAPAVATPLFIPLGDLPGGTSGSHALGISADGLVVVGRSGSSSGGEAFRWTQAEGMVGLGDSPSEAFGASADGSVILGSGSSGTWLWTETEGITGLGVNLRAFPNVGGVSADGSVVVGYTSRDLLNLGNLAARWTQSGGMVPLRDLTGGYFASWASGVSADGSVVVGQSASDLEAEAFRWTEAGGMVGLGAFPSESPRSYAEGVSADGSVVVGWSLFNEALGYSQAFRWTEADGMVGLGDLPGGAFDSYALDVSGDGSVVVGNGGTEGSGEYGGWGNEAFVWDATNGIRNLRAVLVEQGLDLTGWTLRSATAISDDGITIVGYGTDPNGVGQAWLARIPEPSSLLLLAFGIGGMAAARTLSGSYRLTSSRRP